jgi:hypothetical protein
MKHSIPLTLAIAGSLALSQSTGSARDGGNRGGGGFSSNGRSFSAPARSFAPAQRSFAPAQRSTMSAPSFATSGFRSAPSARLTQPAVRNYSYSPRYGNVVRNQAIVPRDSFRGNWDRRGDNHWNQHHYRWAGNRWVIIDGGYGYPYGYSYPYYYGDSYVDSFYAPAVPDYAVTDSLTADVQEALADQGYYHGDIDGEMGPGTREALTAYQRDHRLPATGMINAPTVASLGLD